MTTILNFYNNLPAHPKGYTHFDITCNWSDDRWNNTHDFIQWIFPTMEPSRFNSKAPLLTYEDVQEFQNSEDLKKATLMSFNRFLKSIGYKLVGEQIAPLVPGDNDGEFLTEASINKKRESLEDTHTWMRITRCLASLRLLGLPDYSVNFFSELCNLEAEVPQDTFSYWQIASGATMSLSREQLDELVGLSVAEAEQIVRNYKLTPQVAVWGQPMCAITLPRNVVLLSEENGVVKDADTQEQIDNLYS